MAIFAHFSERAQRAIKAAQTAAVSMQQSAVGTEHILLGLLETDDRIPPEVSSKVSADRVQRMLRYERDSRPEPTNA